MDTNNDSNFIGDFAANLRDQQTGLDPDTTGAAKLHISGCTLQLEFGSVTSFATNGRTPISVGLQAAYGKRKFRSDSRYGCEENSDSDDWFLGCDKKGNDVYMKHYKVFIEPIAESKDKRKGTKIRN